MRSAPQASTTVTLALMFSTTAAIFSLLLVITGVAKLLRPHDVEKALRALRLPTFAGAGLIIGAFEVAVGVGALFFQAALIIQTALYLIFAVWVVVALRREVPLASCGCLGRDDTPPTFAHIVLNFMAVIFSFGAFLGDPLQFQSGLAFASSLVVISAGVLLSYVVLTDAAHLAGVRQQ